MSVLRRGLTTVAIVCLAILGAAGLSGSLVDDDHCATATPALYLPEGTSWSFGVRVWPPGARCTYEIPSGTPAGDSRASTMTLNEGSVGGFLGALAVAALIAGLVARTWPSVPGPLRFVAATAVAFAAFGAGAIVGGLVAGVMVGFALGVPLAWVADCKLRRIRALDAPPTAGLAGAAAAMSGLVLALALWSFGLDLEAFGLALLGVALISALPWRRRPSRDLPALQ